MEKKQQQQFFEVKAPLTSTKIQLYSTSAEALNGKVIRLDLTRNLRGKNMELVMRVKAEGQELQAVPIAAKLVSSFIRRSMRKGADYVEDSFKTKCKDAELVIKPFMITRNKVSRAVRKSLRETARHFIISYVTIRTTHELFSDLMANKLQRELSLKLKKIYPLAFCEIRTFEVDEKTQKQEQKAEQK